MRLVMIGVSNQNSNTFSLIELDYSITCAQLLILYHYCVQSKNFFIILRLYMVARYVSISDNIPFTKINIYSEKYI